MVTMKTVSRKTKHNNQYIQVISSDFNDAEYAYELIWFRPKQLNAEQSPLTAVRRWMFKLFDMLLNGQLEMLKDNY